MDFTAKPTCTSSRHLKEVLQEKSSGLWKGGPLHGNLTCVPSLQRRSSTQAGRHAPLLRGRRFPFQFECFGINSGAAEFADGNRSDLDRWQHSAVISLFSGSPCSLPLLSQRLRQAQERPGLLQSQLEGQGPTCHQLDPNLLGSDSGDLEAQRGSHEANPAWRAQHGSRRRAGSQPRSSPPSLLPAVLFPQPLCLRGWLLCLQVQKAAKCR